MTQWLTDEDRKQFWRSGVGRISKLLFKLALTAFVAPILLTTILVALKNPNVNGIGIGLGVVVSIFILLIGLVVSIIGLVTYKKRTGV